MPINPYASGASSTTAVYAASRAIGVPLPAEVAEVAERTTTIVGKLENRRNGQGDALVLAVVAALETGVDPADDPQVQRVLAAKSLDALVLLPEIVRDTLADLERQSIRLYAPDLVESWAPAFAEAATVLAECHQVLNGTPLDDTDTVVQLGPAASAAWARARAAVETIARINGSWRALHALVVGQEVKVLRMLAIADVSPERWVASDLDGKSADPWDALSRGLTLRLLSITDFTELAAAIRAERARLDELAHSAETERRPAIDHDFIRRADAAKAAERLAEVG